MSQNTPRRIFDIHQHYLPVAAFPDMPAGSMTRVDEQTTVFVSKGVSSLGYEDFTNLPKANRVNEEAGVEKRMLLPSMLLAIFSGAIGIPEIDVLKRLHDNFAELAAEYPGKFLTAATLNPLDASQIREAERAMKHLGCKCICLDTSFRGKFYDTEAAYPFWEYAEAEGIPVFLHPPHLPYGYAEQTQYRLEEVVGRPADTGLSAAKLIYSGIFDRFPRLQVCLAHMGGTLVTVLGRMEFGYRLGYGGLPEAAKAKCKLTPKEYLRKNFWVDTMGFNPPMLTAAIEVFGADRVLFGSDYGPVPISPSEHIEIVEQLNLSEAEKSGIYRGNAERFLNGL